MRTPRASLAAIAALVTVIASAVGCSPAAPARGISLSGIGPITFATGKLDINMYLPGLVRQWNKAHPAEKVTVIQLPTQADDQLAQLVANLQTKTSRYDVMSLDVVWTAQFAANGWIVPVNPKSFRLSGMLAPAVASAKYLGRLYAVPFTSNAQLLYYRKDILAGRKPPKTWAQLAEMARTLAPPHHMAGYAGQLAAYEGLTVNFAEAVQSAGGSILSPDGTKVTVNSPQAREGLSFLCNGLRQGWIPRAALHYEEDPSAAAFESGKLLFLNHWLYVYGQFSAPSPGNKVAGKFGVTTLPGPNGPGSSALGGANLAISAYSRHQITALRFIKFLTSVPAESQILINAAMPPAWTQLYTEPSLVHRFPILPVLKQAILTAKPRPASPDYNQLSLIISSTIHQALTSSCRVGPTITTLSRELNEFIHDNG
jgi:multiple sugar transport system substrate-binding protein